jgi:AcrR family transcriptional regulator
MQRQSKVHDLYNAALKVFGENGYKKTTVEDIADEMNLTKGAIYQYVTGKKQLYDECVKHALWKWQHKVIMAAAKEEDVQKRFICLCKNAMKYLSEDQALLGVLVKDPSIFPLTYHDDHHKEINGRAIDYLEEMLEQGIQEEKFRKVDKTMLAKTLYSIYRMFIIENYIAEENHTEKYLDTVLDMVTKGFYK